METSYQNKPGSRIVSSFVALGLLISSVSPFTPPEAQAKLAVTDPPGGSPAATSSPPQSPPLTPTVQPQPTVAFASNDPFAATTPAAETLSATSTLVAQPGANATPAPTATFVPTPLEVPITALAICPSTIAFGKTIQCSIDIAGEVDAYTFIGAAGDKVLIRGAGTSGSLTAAQAVLRPDGTTLCEFTNAHELTCLLDVSGTHTIQLKDYGGTGIGGYNLHLQRLNNPVGCVPISFGVLVSGFISLATEADCLTFNGTANDRVRAGVVKTSDIGTTLDYSIFNHDGTKLCENNTSVSNEIRCLLDVGGIRTILIRDALGPGIGTYNLQLQRLNNPVGCSTLTFGLTILGSINSAAETDCFRFSGAVNDRVRLRVFNISGTLEYYPAQEILRPDGTTLCGPNTGGEQTCLLDVNGTYTILVNDFHGTGVGNYRLYLQRLNKPTGCIPISFDMSPVSGSIAYAAEMDCFTFKGAINNWARVRVVTLGTWEVSQEVLNPDGTTRCGPTLATYNSDQICLLDLNDTYTVLTKAWNGSSTGTYTIEIGNGWYVGRLTSAQNPSAFGLIDIKTSSDFSRVAKIQSNPSCLGHGPHPFVYEPGLTLPIAEGRFFARNIPLNVPTDPSHTHSMDIDGVFFDTNGDEKSDQGYGGFIFHSGTNICVMQWGATSIGPDSDADGWSDMAEQALGSSTTITSLTPENAAVPTTPTGLSVCGDFKDNDGDGATDTSDSGCPPLPGVALHVQILAPERASPGQTITYVIEYANNGSVDAGEVLLFNSLNPSVRFISASTKGFYNPALHTVEWDLGPVPARTIGSISFQVELNWGLPLDTVINNSVVATDIGVPPSSNIVQDVSALSGLYVNGIGQCGDAWKGKSPEFARNRNKLWVKVYDTCLPWGPDWLELGNDADHVRKAFRDEATGTNGLTDSRITNGSYTTCQAYSGGTATVMRAIISHNLQCGQLVLISPFWDQATFIEDLDTIRRKGVTDIIIWQSEDDKVWTPALPKQIKIPDGHPLRSEPGIRVQDRDTKHGWNRGVRHEQWIQCFNETYNKTNGADKENCDPKNLPESSKPTNVLIARDPNAKHVDREIAQPGETLNFIVEFENEGEGIAYGVYITDTLETDIDVSTLVLPPNEGGAYDPATRTITWYVGEVKSKGKGEYHFSANVRADAPCGAEVTNSATVYFPSVPETTPTNGVAVRVVGPGCDGDSDTILDMQDSCPAVASPPDADGDGQDGEDPIDRIDNDGDGLVDEDYEVGQEDADNDARGDPCDEDDDNDGMIDAFEVFFSICLNPFANDAGADPDRDRKTNYQEYLKNTDPCPLPPPGLLFPHSLRLPQTLRPLFDWAKVNRATSYTLQISTNPTFTALVLNINVTPSAYVVTVDLPRNALLYWRVRANNSNGPGEWSRVRHFNSPNPPGAPTLVAPAHNVIVPGHQPTLDWNDVNPPATYYEVQISTDGNFTTLLGRGQGGRTNLSQYAPETALASNTPYFWRVRAVNGDGQFSQWSAVRSFKTP